MTRIRGTTVIMGVCVALAASTAGAESSRFVGRWHWNRAQSTLPPGEPSPNDLVSEISRADGNSVTWSVTIVRSEEHTSELQSQSNLVCRLLLEKKNSPQSASPITKPAHQVSR